MKSSIEHRQRGAGKQNWIDGRNARMHRQIRVMFLTPFILLAIGALIYYFRHGLLEWVERIRPEQLESQVKTWAPVISIAIALGVLIWQAYTQNQKFKLDFFEKRLKVYEDLVVRPCDCVTI